MSDAPAARQHFVVRLDSNIKTGRQLFRAFEAIGLGATNIDAWNRFFDYLWDRVTYTDVGVVVEMTDDFQLGPADAQEFRWVMENIDEDGHSRIVFTTLHN